MLTIHQSNRIERLADALVSLVAQVAPGADVLTPETLVVPTEGMRRWLAMRIADRLGICANLRLRLPSDLLWDAVEALVPDVGPRTAFRPPVLAWRIAAVLERLDPNDPRFAPLHAYLARARSGDDDDAPRHALAEQIAAIFDRYATLRPAWLLAWDEGAPALGLSPRANLSSSQRERLATDEAWQAALWRLLVAPLDQPGAGAPHRARLLHRAHAAIASGVLPTLVSEGRFPSRILVFPATAQPPATIDLVHALSIAVDVHVFVLNPCREHWAEIRSPREIRHLARDADPEDLHLEVGNGLLASLGRQAREMIDLFQSVDGDAPVQVDLFAEPATAGDRSSLLARLQSDILNLRDRRGTGPLAATSSSESHSGQQDSVVARSDRSIELHACYSPMREVEVLYDRLLDLFDEHSDLEPADVVVMTPDIEAYAPCIEAVFGAAPPERRIPYSIADRSLRTASPLVEAFLAILDLPLGRFELEPLLDLLSTPRIAQHFKLDDADLELVREWVREAGVRWGLDSEHRSELELPGTEEHTWRFGIDRLLLGLAVPDEPGRLFAGLAPAAGAEGSSARILGRIARFVREAATTRSGLTTPRTPAAWAVELAALVDRFFGAASDERAGDPDLIALRAAIDETATAAREADFTGTVSCRVIRARLCAGLDLPDEGRGFLAGRVTFCSLLPMRSVSFAAVFLLGMSDGAFPRRGPQRGFDLTRHRPWRGDRALGDDDRALFLECLLSARRRLSISYVGRCVRTGSTLPPSVVVGELLDEIRRGYTLEPPDRDSPAQPPTTRPGDALVEHLVLDHPLQAFSSRYFVRATTPDHASRWFSYAGELCEAARRRYAAAPIAPRRLLESELALPGREDELCTIDLATLARFFAHPARFLAKERLGIRLPAASQAGDSREPFQLDGLERHRTVASLLATLEGTGSIDLASREARARGLLPHGVGGAVAVGPLLERVRAFRAARQELQDRLGPSLDPAPVSVVAIDGITLMVDSGARRSQGQLHGRCGKLRAKDLCDFWIRHLALCASVPDQAACTSLWLGEDGHHRLDWTPDASTHLAGLVRIYRDGICRPVAFFPETSRQLAARTRSASPSNAWELARKKWRPDYDPSEAAESNDPWVRLIWQDVDPFTPPFDEEMLDLAECVFPSELLDLDAKTRSKAAP